MRHGYSRREKGEEGKGEDKQIFQPGACPGKQSLFGSRQVIFTEAGDVKAL